MLKTIYIGQSAAKFL